MNASTVLTVSNMLCNIFLSTRDLYADCIDALIYAYAQHVDSIWGNVCVFLPLISDIVDRYDCHMESIGAFIIYHPNVFAIESIWL